MLYLEGRWLLLVKRSIDYLAVNRGELSELLKVDLNVGTLLKKVSDQLEQVVKAILDLVLVL